MVEIPQTLIIAANNLVGQLLAVQDLDVQIIDYAFVQDLTRNGKLIDTKGVFLVLKFKVANLGKTQINSFGAMLQLLDDHNTQITGFLDLDAIFAISEMNTFQENKSPMPGFVGKLHLYYDLPLNITDIKLVVHPSYIIPNRQPSMDSFLFSGGRGPDSGAGQELVGKVYLNRKKKKKATIVRVDRFTEVDTGSEIIKAEGIFLAIAYILENKGKEPINWPSFQIEDDEGRIWGGNVPAYTAFAKYYNREITIYPGHSGPGYVVFEVLKESKGFKIAPGFFD